MRRALRMLKRNPVRIAGMFWLVLAAGCAALEEAPPNMEAQAGPPIVDPSRAGPAQDGAAAAEPPRAEAVEEALTPAPPPTAPPQPAMTADAASANLPETGAATAPPASRGAASAAQPPPKERAKVSVAAAAIEQPRKPESPPAAARKPEPPLDVAALKSRLRDTNAIGVFTKLALKNQVDDLLQQFRTHYLSGRNTSVAPLRQPYDMLVLKVLALIQDSDPSLARTISGSREAIWGILADPEKFNSVN